MKDNGGNPSDLIRLADGSFLGTATLGGTANSGVLFRLDRHGNETVIHNFNGRSDGFYPFHLISDCAGHFYGASFNTIFKLDEDENFSIVANVGTSYGRLLLSDGSLYGVTFFGGTYTNGSIFKVNIASGKVTLLHSFTGGFRPWEIRLSSWSKTEKEISMVLRRWAATRIPRYPSFSVAAWCSSFNTA